MTQAITISRRLLRLRENVERLQRAAERAVPMWLILLGARAGVGAVFFRSGLLKTDNWQLTLLLFRNEYKVPLIPYETAALLATATELSMPLLLFAGALTRLAALPLLGMTLVIQTFVYPNAWSEHLMWTVLLVLVISRGPGGISLDYLLRIDGRHAAAAPRAS